jgi:cytochrome c-type biogenesis protein CcmF
MFPEIGHFALALALALALVQSVLPIAGASRGNAVWMKSAQATAIGQVLFVAIAFAALMQAFIASDFTVRNVVENSHSLKPMLYKVAGTWGSHEGSLLLWILILAVFGAGVAWFGSNIPAETKARTLSVQAWISVGFLSFLLLTSNPFERVFPPPLDGNDLNPLLQDMGLAMHPPLLYFGYVGYSIVFSFAVAALLEGRVDPAWARWVRPWTLAAWVSLTAGIALGSWWAYYELGWGGWWFWDPVENASFMPWLVGTALIHSLAVTEKRGVFKSWTLLLAIFAFSLSLLGTFLVRSGVLTSVHAFAADPTRGMFILGFLVIVVGGSLTLYAFRAPSNQQTATFTWLSREALLLVNNILLLVAAMTVLLGTLFPLIMDFAGLGKYSVGPPYFNAIFVPLMCFMALVVGIGPSSQWKRSQPAAWARPLIAAFVSSVVLGFIIPQWFGDGMHIGATIGVLLAAWIVLSSVVSLRSKVRNAPTLAKGLRRLTPSYYGMLIAHIGFAASVLGVAMVTSFNDEQDIRMEVGERTKSAFSYEVSFDAMQAITGPNYQGQRGTFSLWQGEELIAELHPEKRRYHARSSQVMTEAAIDAGLMRDVYIALGEPVGKDAWAVRIHVKPFVRWIWLGAILMAIGGLLAICDKRYRPSQKIAVNVEGERSATT